MDAPTPKKTLLDWLKIACVVSIVAPGFLLLMHGKASNDRQAAFRMGLFVVGLIGYVAIMIYQLKKRRDNPP